MKNKKLRKLLVDKECNLTELAKATNVTLKQVSRIVNGQSNGSLKWWKKAAEVLGCELSDIVE